MAERYPPGTIVKGTVRNLTNYGAFIEIEEGIDGLLHVSDMSWTRKISHPNEMVEKGQEIECRVLSVDQERRRIALGLKQMTDDPWATDIPGKYQPGQIVKGKVTKITNFGVFVELETGPGRPAAHLRAGRPQGREPRGGRQGRRRDRGEGPARRCRRAEDRPVAQAGGMGRGRATAPTASGRAASGGRRGRRRQRAEGRRGRRQRPADSSPVHGRESAKPPEPARPADTATKPASSRLGVIDTATRCQPSSATGELA